MNISVNLPNTTAAQRREAALAAIAQYDLAIAWAADTLIPEDVSLGMPSATQAGLLEVFLPKALSARDDMLDDFVIALAQLPTVRPNDPMAVLKALPNGGFDVLARVIAGSYFWSADINQKLKYPGQEEIRETPDYDYLMTRIAQVVERGEIFIQVE